MVTRVGGRRATWKATGVLLEGVDPLFEQANVASEPFWVAKIVAQKRR
jgi:hypothetical protein